MDYWGKQYILYDYYFVNGNFKVIIIMYVYIFVFI